jgi:hypothetical protein
MDQAAAQAFGLFLIAVGVLHLGFAAGVWADADKLKKNNEKLWFAGAFFWTLAVLLGGVLMATAYWLIHHSTIRSPATPAQSQTPEGQ